MPVRSPKESTAVFLGLGSNCGDRLGYLRDAVRLLGSVEGIRPLLFSPVYETEPVGGPPQDRFLNAAVGIATVLSPEALLERCRAVEDALGRTRDVRWGPRTVDIDVLLFGDAVIRTADLEIPHPRMHERAFVLAPLADIAPDAVHPVLGMSVGVLFERAGAEGIQRTGFSLGG